MLLGVAYNISAIVTSMLKHTLTLARRVIMVIQNLIPNSVSLLGEMRSNEEARNSAPCYGSCFLIDGMNMLLIL